MKNKDINMGRPGFTIENLKEALRRLEMCNTYYILHGQIKNHSFVLETINNKESRVKFIGENGEVLGQTMILENWRAYSNLYRRTYSLYLLDQYCQKLIDNNEIDQPFTDDDYKTFLFPSSYGN